MRRGIERGVIAATLLALFWIACAPAQPGAQTTTTASRFAADIAALSEPGGYFDTDNLISNERSYLHAVSDLADANVSGGVYLGVGPEQNFSYIAAIRPDVAYLIDIRRDNLLLHLLFKAIFAEAPTRADYLALLFGTARVTAPADASISALADRIDRAERLPPSALQDLRRRLTTTIRASGVPLSAADLETIDRFHRQFMDGGLSLQFHSTGRAPQFGYPTYRDLALEVDRHGRERSFLAKEEDFQFVKALEARDAVVPIVGDLSGSKALAAVARAMTERQQRLSAFYASNVEFYLFRDGSFPRWVANLARLPRAEHAVVIRSVFGGAGSPMPGYNSAQVTQSVAELVNGFGQGRYRNYGELTVGSRFRRTGLQR